MNRAAILLLIILATGCDDNARQQDATQRVVAHNAVAQGAASQAAATLDGLLQSGRIDHFECFGSFPGMTNAFYAEVGSKYFCLFDATNRVQVSSDVFYSNSPARIVFFSGTNSVVALGYGNDVFAFRDYYFRLNDPTNCRNFFPPF